ncbi:MAG: vWA domain-containing protein [Pirellulales bacterium]
MNSFHQSSRSRIGRKSRRGAMLVLIIITLVVLLVGAMFSIDIAYMHVVRAELRTATDAAARAGASTLARNQSTANAITSAKNFAAKNAVAGKGLTLSSGDIELGGIRANGSKLDFVLGSKQLAAVRVHGHRDSGSIDGTVPLFFGRAFNLNTFAPSESATSAANVRDVALVLDVSGSMEIPMGSVTRLQALQRAVSVFLDELGRSSPLVQVSLSVYSTGSVEVVPLTQNLNTVRNSVSQLQAFGTTAIGLGLQSGVNSLKNDPLTRPFAVKTVIVMTDGQHNTGPSPLITVSQAVAAGFTVHTITFSPDANEQLMQAVANSTQGGQHFHANDGTDLTDAFRSIAKNLSVVLIN